MLVKILLEHDVIPDSKMDWSKHKNLQVTSIQKQITSRGFENVQADDPTEGKV